jgi:acetyltransferase-like isoleucine patch superfamily enzyme
MMIFVPPTPSNARNYREGRLSSALRNLAADLQAAVFHCAVNVGIGSSLLPGYLRRALYRFVGFEIRGATLSPHLTFRTNKINIGDHVFINERCSFDNIDHVTVGDWVHMGPEVHVSTSSHEMGNSIARAGATTSAPVAVGAGCWIGARAVLLPGVTVGEGCVVAAGAVVAQSCEPHGLYAGVPARRIRDLPVAVRTAMPPAPRPGDLTSTPEARGRIGQ